MRNCIAAMALTMGFVTGFVGVAQAVDPPKTLSTLIKEVTIYADRARVTRVGALDIAGADSQVVVTGLPGWIDQESVRVTLSPASRGRILDVTTETTFLATATKERVRLAEAAVLEVADKLAEINDERRVLQAEIKQLEAVRAFSVAKLPRDMAARPVKPRAFGETIDFVSTRLRKIHAAVRVLNKHTRELQPELARRKRARADLQMEAKLQQSQVTVGLSGAGRAKLILTYLTPGASWEPVAELRTQKGKTATLVQYASVVQTTGEDWVGAKLSFSTQRPGETLAVPAAQALLVGGGGRGLGNVMQRMGASFDRAQVAYSQQNELVVRSNASWSTNVKRQRSVQTRAIASFRKLRKRGTTAHFVARASRAVRASGKPVRVPIAEGAFDLKSRLVAVPEVSLNAVRTAQLVNTTGQAILPGKAALFADGAFVGKTELDFVAPGESFSVFLGVDDGIKLERTLDRTRSSIDRGRKRTDLTVSYRISARNLSKRPITVDLTDRVPVVQDDDIDLDDLVIPEHAKRHRDGLVKWRATLAPGAEMTWRIEYELEYPTGLAARPTPPAQKRRRGGRPEPSRMLYDDIKQLESAF